MPFPLQERYVNLLTDFGFKRVFGSEPNKQLLINFLNTLLPAHHQIKELSYKSTENLGSTQIDRKAIFDIYCQSEDGDRFIVELQKAKQNFFKDRSVFYASFPIQEQALKGEWNFQLAPVYSIGILDFVFDEHQNDETIIHTVKLKNQHCQVFYDKLTFIYSFPHFACYTTKGYTPYSITQSAIAKCECIRALLYVELPKFDKTLSQLGSQQDKWLYLFRHLPELDDQPQLFQDPVFLQLFEIAEIANFSRTEQDSYQSSLKYYRDMNNVIDTSRMEGRAEGKAEGRAEGRAERQSRGQSRRQSRGSSRRPTVRESCDRLFSAR